jgi:hypothetical protein
MAAIQYWVGWAGAAGILAVIVVVLIGFVQGQRRAQGRASGAGLRFLRLPLWAYLFTVLCLSSAPGVRRRRSQPSLTPSGWNTPGACRAGSRG